jgi:ParB-like nuclease domain
MNTEKESKTEPAHDATEISPGHSDGVRRRIAQPSGEDPVPVETGASITQIAAERRDTECEDDRPQEDIEMRQDVLDLKIEQWPVERLVPYARNARTHSDGQVAQVAASISEFGFVNPILVASDRVIIAGHARLLAARKLAMSEVPVIVLGHLSGAQRRALVIADNRLALNAGWDEEMLALELAALRDEDFSLDILGFDDEELNHLLAAEGATEGLTDEDSVPEVPETPVSQAGDLWSLGNHKLLVGDATVAADVQRLMGPDAADCVFSDPPYNIDFGNHHAGATADAAKPVATVGAPLREVAPTVALPPPNANH